MNVTQTSWIEFDLVGPIETQKYRTNMACTVVQFWFDKNVNGICKKGWNVTKSATAQMRARAAIRAAINKAII